MKTHLWSRALSRRQFFLQLAITTSTVALANCAAPSAPITNGPLPESPSATTAQVPDTPVTGGTLNMAGSQGRPTYFPMAFSTIGHLHEILSLFTPLVYGRTWTEGMTPSGTGPVELGVASSMTQIEKDRVWEFELREDIRWHDGQPVTADDLIFGVWMNSNIEFAPYNVPRGIKGISRLQEEGGGEDYSVEGITKLGERAVRIELDVPLPYYWEQGRSVYPMPLHILGDDPQIAWEEPFATMPVGNGAFKPSSFVDGQYYELVANEDYYMGRPLIDKVVFRVTSQNSVAMEAQEIDGAFFGIPTPEFQRLSELPYVRTTTIPLASPHGIRINTQRFPEYASLHKVVLHALDMEAINQNIYAGGLNLHNYHFVHSLGLETAPQGFPLYTYNPNRAKELLAEINWDTNQVLEWVIDAEPNAFQITIQAMLAEVGLQTEFRQVESGIEVIFTQHDFDFMSSSSYGGSDMENFWLMFKCGADFNNGGTNHNLYCNEEVDGLWASALVQTDPVQRVELFNQISLILADDMPMAVLHSPNVVYAWNERVQGAYPFNHFVPARPALERVWLWPNSA